MHMKCLLLSAATAIVCGRAVSGKKAALLLRGGDPNNEAPSSGIESLSDIARQEDVTRPDGFQSDWWKKEIGDRCLWDSQCTSDHCAGLLSRVCVECEEDDDCDGQGESPPGEDPNAFCYKGDGWENARCSKWKRGRPLGPQGYPIVLPLLDHPTIWVPRTVVEIPPAEQVYHFPLDGQPNGATIEVNGTHALIPKNTHLLAGYARTDHMLGEHESGIVSTVWDENPTSVITDRAHTGLAEKYHTLSHTGPWSTQSADRVHTEVSSRDKATSQKATEQRNQRDYLISAMDQLSKLSVKQLEAGQDIEHIKQIRQYVESNDGTTGVAEKIESSAWHEHDIEAQQALHDSANKTSMKSENSCIHFESTPSLGVTDSHVVFPLNKNVVVGSGRISFSPLRTVGFLFGSVVAKFDESTNSLKMYIVATQQMRSVMDPAIDTAGVVQPNLWVGPADGENMAVSPIDGRTDEFYDDSAPGFATKVLIDSIEGIPVDYSRFDKDPSEQCPRATLDDVFSHIGEAKALLSQSGEGLLWKLQTFHKANEAISNSVDCGIPYLKSDLAGSNGFESLELSVWGHLFYEAPSNVVAEVMTSQYWNDWKYPASSSKVDTMTAVDVAPVE